MRPSRMELPVSPDAPNKPTQHRVIAWVASISSTFTNFAVARWQDCFANDQNSVLMCCGTEDDHGLAIALYTYHIHG